MIDFRYHLVSIAAIFLALAVGIVLGAGPLKGTLGDTLAGEVAQLRTDADTLRSDLADAEAAVTSRDDVLTTVRPRTTSGVLSGTSVSILALPGSPDAAVESARQALAEAGGTIAADVRVDPSWTSEDPPEVTDRTAAAAELRELLAGDLPVGIAPERVIALSLGWALGTDPTAASADTDAATPTEMATDAPDATDAPTEADSESDDLAGSSPRREAAETSARILEILASYGLLTIEGENVGALTDGVVIVTPSSTEDEAPPVTEWSDLAGAVDEAGAVVVAGDLRTDVDPAGHLVAAIRDSGELSDRVSTLDHLATPMGDLALPFVLVEQLAGSTGHYGTLGSAGEDFPPVPPDDAP